MEGTFKRCFKCGLTFPITEFYAHPKMADGHLNKCKRCAKNDVHKNYMKNIEDDAYVEKERKRGRDKYKKYHYKRSERNEYLNISKNTRRDFETKYGKLQKDIELHHWNYNKPKDIILLNARIHKRLHKLITINRKTKTFIVNETGEKLNTMKKHCDFIEKNFPLYTISRIFKL